MNLRKHENARIKYEERFINEVCRLFGMTYGDAQDMEGLESTMYDGWICEQDAEWLAGVFLEELDNNHPTRQ